MSSLRIASAAVLLVTALACGILAFSAPPVLFILNLEPAAVRPIHLVIQNPFRDHGPEIAAHTFLKRLRAGDTQSLKVALCNHEMREIILESEARYPVQAWRLDFRVDNAEGTWLSYNVRRGGGYGPDYDGDAGLLVTRSPTGWSVSCFNASY
jgi:hypothetical protein